MRDRPLGSGLKQISEGLTAQVRHVHRLESGPLDKGEPALLVAGVDNLTLHRGRSKTERSIIEDDGIHREVEFSFEACRQIQLDVEECGRRAAAWVEEDRNVYVPEGFTIEERTKQIGKDDALFGGEDRGYPSTETVPPGRIKSVVDQTG